MGRRGKYSFRHADQVISLSPDFKTIEWRLGGPGSSFSFPDPSDVFHGQHGVLELPNGHLTMFDNGNYRPEGEYSRALELELDFTIANRLVTRGGYLTGEVKINVEHGCKGEAVDLFCHQFGIDAAQVIAVGDSAGDISMFRAVGYSVAFNPVAKQVARAASSICVAENLTELLKHLPLDPRGSDRPPV